MSDSEYAVEHQSLMADKHSLYFEDKSKINFEKISTYPRLIAFYSSHDVRFSDSDASGGILNWHRTVQEKPRFVGHYQPRLPIDLDSYGLEMGSLLEKQIELAKDYGIYGFCFWLENGVLDQPIQSMLAKRNLDFSFMVAVRLSPRKFSDPDEKRNDLNTDFKNLIDNIGQILTDDRYIHNDGKAVLAVAIESGCALQPEVIEHWRNRLRELCNKEFEILAVVDSEKDFSQPGFDSILPREPYFTIQHLTTKNKLVDDLVFEDLYHRNFEPFAGTVVNYRHIVKAALNKDIDVGIPAYAMVAPDWDESLKINDGVVISGSNPILYGKWLRGTLSQQSKMHSNPIIFINSWNAWDEASALEPDTQYGYAYLNETARALVAFDEKTQLNWPVRPFIPSTNKKLAVVLHAYYVNKFDYIAEKLALVSEPFDLFISTPKTLVDFVEHQFPDATVFSVPNRGRDVLPFINLAPQLTEAGYEYVLKIHSKQSVHRGDGELWFESLMDGLLPDREIVAQIQTHLASGQAAIAGPQEHYISLRRAMFSNEEMVAMLFDAIGFNESVTNPRLGFFAGTMFWSRLDALKPFLDLNLLPEDFPDEQGQIDGTIAHAMERLFAMIGQDTSKPGAVYLVSRQGIIKNPQGDAPTIYPWVRSLSGPEIKESKRLFDKTRKFLVKVSQKIRL